MSADSAGTAAYHVGEQPDYRSIKVAQQHGVPIDHRARQFVSEDFERFDYILAMDQQNYNDMKDLAKGPTDHLFLLREFDQESNIDLDVPDPYYGGDDGFEKVFDMVSRSVDVLISHIKQHP